MVKTLRAFKGGRLLSTFINDQERLPQSESKCGIPTSKRGRFCFVAGDGRVNENVNLVVLHNVFLKHHNQVQ